jgi:hypothetical protein
VAAGDNGSVCVDVPAFRLTGFSPAGGSWSGPGVDAAGVFNPASVGVGMYTLSYRVEEQGCVASASRSITVRPALSVSLPPFSAVCSGNTNLVLAAGHPAGGSWSGPGVSEGIFNATVAGIGTHTLTYSYTDAGGCTAAASQPITVTTCTGIPEELAADWSVYPNPASDKIRVRVSVPARSSVVFRILRADGSLVLEKSFPQVVGEVSQVFDLKGQGKGLYLLQQITDQGMATRQFILQ